MASTKKISMLSVAIISIILPQISVNGKPLKKKENDFQTRALTDREIILKNSKLLKYHLQAVTKNPSWTEHNESQPSSSERPRFTEGTCLACTLVLKYEMARLKKVKNADKVVKQVLVWLQKACILFGFETPRVCRGGISIFGPHVISVLQKISMTPEEICSLTFPEKCLLKTVGSFSTEWNIDIPPQPKVQLETSEKRKSPGPKTLKVLHLSDVHIDLHYAPGSNAECKEPLCCRASARHDGKVSKFAGNWTREAYKIAVQFSPKVEPVHHAPKGAGYWGDYRQCDLPTQTLEHLLKTVADGAVNERFLTENKSGKARKIDYIIWTGDIPAHDVWAQSKDTQIYYLNYMTRVLLKYFPDTMVYPAVGNHDSFPSNHFPGSNDGKKGNNSAQWFYEALADAWSPWLPEDALKTVRLGAYYTAVVEPGYRIVSLNTNFCYSENWWIFLNLRDPADMLQWFVNVLLLAERNGEKVHVIGHVPPGRQPDCLKTWSRNYYRIIERFKNTITGQFFGHTHFDEIQLFYGRSGQPMSVAYLAPSVTPYVDMNPAFRVYDVSGFGDNSDWTVVNHNTYVLNLEEANRSGRPRWNLEYNALTAYNMSELSPENWGEMVNTWKGYFAKTAHVKGDPPQTLVKYIQFYSKGRMKKAWMEPDGSRQVNSNTPCERLSCARKTVCNIVKNVQWDICSP